MKIKITQVAKAAEVTFGALCEGTAFIKVARSDADAVVLFKTDAGRAMKFTLDAGFGFRIHVENDVPVIPVSITRIEGTYA